jgi:hypothetical protein
LKVICFVVASSGGSSGGSLLLRLAFMDHFDFTRAHDAVHGAVGNSTARTCVSFIQIHKLAA